MIYNLLYFGFNVTFFTNLVFCKHTRFTSLTKLLLNSTTLAVHAALKINDHLPIKKLLLVEIVF